MAGGRGTTGVDRAARNATRPGGAGGGGFCFGDAIDLINGRSKAHVLRDARCGASIVVWPAMQGRVLCSSMGGMDGAALGWVNRDLISSNERMEHFNPVGGADRIWLGPEGGQFSLYFAPSAPFDLDHWYTPAPLDTEPFDLCAATGTSLSFRKSLQLSNYSGTEFRVRIDREVRLLSQRSIWSALDCPRGAEIQAVGFESENTLTNIADSEWTRKSGLISLWVLGQFEATAQTSIVLPIRTGPETELGPPVTPDYFGPVPADRISIREDSILLRADGKFRSKLGLSQARSRAVLGSYDARNRLLTVVQFTQPRDAADYVNSRWMLQDDPYRGDAANCYNDGPAGPGGKQLGAFYELESSSPARPLSAGESIVHTHRTIHLTGDEEQLDAVSQSTLGVRLRDAQTIAG